MLNRHEPDKQFVENLEWQIGAEARRRNRSVTAPRPLWRLARVAAMVVVSMAIGAAAMAASYQIEESWRKELLVSQLEARANLTEQRLAMFAEEMERVQRQFEAGAVGENTLLQTQMQLDQMRIAAESLQLDLEEVMASGREPSNELSAPLVGGRDFVSERINLQIEMIDQQLELAAEELNRAGERFEAGVESRGNLDSMTVAVREIRAHRSHLEGKLVMREGILAGRISPVEAELITLRDDAEKRAETLKMHLAASATEVEDMRTRVAAGLVDETTFRVVELQLSEMEAQIELAEREQEIVERELQRIRRQQ
jgi:hypothetical protein